jgi:methylated-DNA-[protein]-cysteine S-methyltransferase
MEKIFHITFDSPVGLLVLTSDEKNLTSISFNPKSNSSTDYVPEILSNTSKQLKEYFEGIRKEFNLNLNPYGTNFQQEVWQFVKSVPYGKTVTYLDIALQTGSKNNTRAVGLANGRNPIPIIIPCHRVIGTDGKLTGYAGGIERKRWLLQHELKHSNNPGLLF